MKYLKKFNEMLDTMGSWNPSQLNNAEFDEDLILSLMKDKGWGDLSYNRIESFKNSDYYKNLTDENDFVEQFDLFLHDEMSDDEYLNNKSGEGRDYDNDICQDCYCTPCQCDELMDDELERELKEAKDEKKNLLDYFMDMSNEELIEYEKNFKHSFEDPQHHNPEYVAYKTACRLKRVFMSK